MASMIQVTKFEVGELPVTLFSVVLNLQIKIKIKIHNTENSASIAMIRLRPYN